jgi:hypothetical protein
MNISLPKTLKDVLARQIGRQDQRLEGADGRSTEGLSDRV